jgi:hypothetical protein
MAGKIIHKSPMKGRQVVNAHNLRKTFMIFTEGQTEEGYLKKFLAHIWQSKKDGSMVNVFCPNSYGERCPIDEYRSKVWKTGSDEEKENIKIETKCLNFYLHYNIYMMKNVNVFQNAYRLKKWTFF